MCIFPCSWQGFIQGVVRGRTCPSCLFKCPPRKPFIQRSFNCTVPLRYLNIPDCPPCMQILYETLVGTSTLSDKTINMHPTVITTNKQQILNNSDQQI